MWLWQVPFVNPTHSPYAFMWGSIVKYFYRIFNLLSVSIGSDRCQLSTQPNPPCAFMWVSIGFLRFFLKWFSIESLVFTSSICHLNPTPLCLNMSFNWIFGNYQLNLWIWQMSFVNPTLGYAFSWISIRIFYRIFWKDFQLNLFVT